MNQKYKKAVSLPRNWIEQRVVIEGYPIVYSDLRALKDAQVVVTLYVGKEKLTYPAKLIEVGDIELVQCPVPLPEAIDYPSVKEEDGVEALESEVENDDANSN